MVGHVVKIGLEAGLQRGWPGLGGEPTSLPRILPCCHM
jgi:hypothetical protein